MPIGLLVSPVDTGADPAWVTVKDLGGIPLRVSTETLILHAHCQATRASGITVQPAVFTLHAGGHQRVKITVPRGQDRDNGVLFIGSPIGVHPGSDLLAGGVGVQLEQGGAVSCVPPRFVHHPASFPWLPTTLIPAALLLCIIAFLWTLRRRRVAPN